MLASAGAGLALVVCLFLYNKVIVHLQNKRLADLLLTPNILLTKYPILFVDEKRSLFNMRGSFCDLPYFLKEHGYQVGLEKLSRNYRSQDSLVEKISELLNDHAEFYERVHLVLSHKMANAGFNLARQGHFVLQSLTILEAPRHVTEEPAPSPPRNPSQRPTPTQRLTPPRVPVYRLPYDLPHPFKKGFDAENSVLQHCVSLAESELQ